MKKKYTIAITGNPNTGKTSLFNVLAHQNQHVGNWPGVTIEKKEGTIFEDENKIVNIVDLPGIYSLRSNSEDEIVASNFLLKEKPDFVIVVVDASRLERSLYLYTQIKELGFKTIIALNMIDIAKSNSIQINAQKLSELLSCPVIKTIGNRHSNIEVLKTKIIDMLDENQNIISTNFSQNIIEKLSQIKQQLPKESTNFAIKILEKDSYFIKTYKIDIKKYNFDIKLQTKIIEERWKFIQLIVSQVITKNEDNSKAELITEKIDKIVINKYFGLPIFFFVIFLMFFFVYSIGNPIVEILEICLEKITEFVSAYLESINTPKMIRSFITDGIMGGVGAVIVFFPNIFILFFFLGILEDTGYLSRGTFVMDKLMHSIGLHGKSFIPLIMGFGCSVPAILGTRIMEKKRDKLLTMLVIPFISCSARLPVFVIFASVFLKVKHLLLYFLYMLLEL